MTPRHSRTSRVPGLKEIGGGLWMLQPKDHGFGRIPQHSRNENASAKHRQGRTDNTLGVVNSRDDVTSATASRARTKFPNQVVTLPWSSEVASQANLGLMEFIFCAPLFHLVL